MKMLASLLGGWKLYLLMGIALLGSMGYAYKTGRSDGRAIEVAKYEAAANKDNLAVIARLDQIAADNAESRAAQAERDKQLIQNQVEQTNAALDAISGIPRPKPVTIVEGCDGDFSLNYDATVGLRDNIADLTSPNN